jgi:hypothetical protein
MKWSLIKFMLIVLTLGLTLSLGLGLSAATASEPEYAKWGRLAMQQTSAKYEASIVDYLHIGRTQISPGIAEEAFKLWLRERRQAQGQARPREFGVIITFRFYTADDRLISVRYEETSK